MTAVQAFSQPAAAAVPRRPRSAWALLLAVTLFHAPPAFAQSSSGAVTLASAPTGTTSQANPEIQVVAPGKVSYRYSLNGAPYSPELPIGRPIRLAGGVTVGDTRFAAGTSPLIELLRLRSTDEAFSDFIDRLTFDQIESQLQVTYTVNRMRTAVEPENIVNLHGPGVTDLEVTLLEKVPAGPRFELSAFAVSAGVLVARPGFDGVRRFTLSVPRSAAAITVTPTVNNNQTLIAVNGQPAASGQAIAVPAPAEGGWIDLHTTAPDGSAAHYQVEIHYDDALGVTGYRSYYLRAFTPASSYVSIRNTGAGIVDYKLTFNQKFGVTTDEIIEEILGTAPEYPGESTARRVWRFIRDNKYHFDPLSGARWNHSPGLFFNSIGFGYCDDSASLFRHLMTALGYPARVWGLGPEHVVAEAFVDGRWEMWDPDLQVYYRNRAGLVAGVQELAADPGLITQPLDPVPGALDAYHQLIADIYASQANNGLSSWYDFVPVTGDSSMVLQIPPGGVFEFPDIYDGPLSVTYMSVVPSYANARLIVPAGFSGTLSLPLVIQSIGWSNTPALRVITRDAAGNWDTEPTVATWTVDAEPPFTTATQPSGSYNFHELVTLTASESATIYYTTDGSIPTDASAVFGGPIAISAGEFVKFFAIDRAGNRERVRVYGPAVQQVQLQLASMTGTTATFVATASGGSGSYEYMFELLDTHYRSTVQPYAATTTWTWNKSGVTPGSYTVVVCARNLGTAAACESAASLELLVQPAVPPVLINPGDQIGNDQTHLYPAVVRDHAPVAHWRLDEERGAVAVDSAGIHAGGRFGGLTGALPGALADGSTSTLFNGTDSYIRMPNSEALQLAADLTIELWVNVPLAARQTLISKSSSHEFELTLETDGRLNLYHGDGSTFQWMLSDVGAVAPNTWQHVVVTRTAATRSVRFYVNGHQAGSATYADAPAISTRSISIGRSEAGVQYVNGRLDEVALYPVALTAAQVHRHYVMRLADGAGAPVQLPLVATDANDDPLTYTAIGLPPGLAIDASTGLISGVLTAASTGVHQVVATSSDGALSDSQSFQWTVAHVNRAPALTNPGPQENAENASVALQLSAADLESDVLTFSAIGLPPSLSIDPATGLVSGTLSFSSMGSYPVTATVSDGASATTQTFIWTVANTNRPPVLAHPGAQMHADSVKYAEAVKADGAVAYWRLDDPAGTSAADSVGMQTGTLAGGVLVAQPGVLADGNTAMFFNGSAAYVRVFSSPVVQLAGDLTIEMWINVSLAARQTLISKGYLREFELTLETSGRLNLYQGNGVTYRNALSAFGAVSAGTWQHVVVTRSASTGIIRFYVNGLAKGTGMSAVTPSAGTGEVHVGRAQDGGQYVNGRLDEVAIYPVVLSSGQVAAHWELRAHASLPTPIALALSAVDPDGDAVTYGATGLPPGVSIDSATGLISGALSPASQGTHQVTGTASDGNLTASQTFDWTITHVNRHPVLIDPGHQSSGEGSSISLALSASDPDDDVVAFGATGLPPSVVIDPGTGVISGTLPFGSAGTYQVTVTASDATLSATQVFTWSVVHTNRPPVLVNPGAQVHTDSWSYAQAVRADGAFTYWRFGEPAGVPATDSAGGLAGTLSGSVVSGQPGALADGHASMLFNGTSGHIRVPNSTGLQLAGDLTIEMWINVSLAARQTLISKGYLHEFELTLETTGRLNLYQGNGITYAGVLSAFAAVAPGTWQHVVVTRSAATRTIRFYVNGLAKGSGTYALTPAAGASALFIGRGAAGSQYVNGWVDEVALYPVVLTPTQAAAHHGLAASVSVPTAVTLRLAAVDPDGDAVAYSATGLPGGLTVNSGTGLISGTLPAEAAGTYQVTAMASDGHLSVTQAFDWTVSHLNRAPRLTNPGSQTYGEGTPAALQLTAADVDGDAMTFTAAGLPPAVTIDPATGLISGVAPFTSAGTYAVSVAVSDGTVSAAQTFTWTVVNTNRAPVLANPGNQSHFDTWDYSHAVRGDNPVAYWRLGDPAGAVALDTVSAQSGTVYGNVLGAQPGALGDGNAAMLFNGANGYVRVPNSPQLQLAGDLTIEMWINVSLTARQTLISKDYLHEFELTLETTGRLNLYQGNGTTYAGALSAFGAVTANSWQHVVVTRSAATRTIRFFVNGVAKGSATYALDPAAGSDPIAVGRAKGGSQYVNGRLDEVAVYAAVLNAGQAAAHHALRDSPATGMAVVLQLAGGDPDGEPVTYSAVGLPPGLSIDPASGSISGTLSSTSVGSHQVTVTVSDGNLATTQAFTWTVND